MAHLIQVGAGSGGMPVLDMLCRDARITRVTLIEPDEYQAHNTVRHPFPRAAIGSRKADWAERWLKERRPGLEVRLLPCDLLDPARQDEIDRACADAQIGVCAADNEAAKFAFDALMRRHAVPWTLGEVLSGGIGGFVHWFVPGGPCYGCVASHLQRSLKVEPEKTPDYAQPGGPVETTIPASMASIGVIAAMHALITLELLDDPAGYEPGFNSLLFTMKRVPGVFDEAFRPHRFRIARHETCLICSKDTGAADSSEDLDVALDQALARLGNG